MPDERYHSIDVRDKPGFLHRVMTKLVGHASISLEGDLSRCTFGTDLVVSHEPTEILRRNTIWPVQEFVILRLTPESVSLIFRQVMGAGLKRAVVHIQIERDGVLELGAYDSFHRECVATGPGISEDLLPDLKRRGVVRDFKTFSRPP